MIASRRFPIRIAGGILAGALVLATALHASMAAPSDLDLSRTRVTDGGAYRMTFTPEGDSIRVGKLHSWRLHLETIEGTAVDSATIAVKGGMPQHGHGLPTKPRVTRSLGGGDYLVEGMKFNMRGWWVVTFRLQAAGAADSVTFNLKL
ncbi:MAG TPA: FixH family protein [Gemmatimonadales bacterium]